MDWNSIIFGAFLGLVMLPVIYDVGLYLVMRGEFLIWHGMRAVAIVVMALAGSSAVLPGAFDTEHMRWLLNLLSTDLSIAVSGPFLVAYVEKDKIAPRLALALRLCLPAVLIGTMLKIGFPDDALLSYARNTVFLGVLILLIWGLGQALFRGSRAARYQATAWSAVFAVCGYALYSELVLLDGWDLWLQAILSAIALEIVVTAAGIADRFMVLKRERDEARQREAVAQDASITDPLTQLRNRRGLSRRFAAGDRDPPRAVAILDIDHFKRINDTFGHDVGDEVLVAVARALLGRNRFAARLGGEEFALILFGKDWQRDIDEARRAVSHYVRMEVEEIDWLVTASAGVVAAEADMPFSDLMRAADQALYEAKEGGRDRTVVGGGQARKAAA